MEAEAEDYDDEGEEEEDVPVDGGKLGGEIEDALVLSLLLLLLLLEPDGFSSSHTLQKRWSI
jgi:hypothetical protein